jgi:hypothetical protein
MPYLTTRDGKTEFIADQQQFNEREAAEWGGQPQQRPTAPAAKASPKPAATAKPKPQQRGFDIGRFLQNTAGAVSNIKVPKTWKDAGRLILNQLSGINPSAQMAGVEPPQELPAVRQAREKRIKAAEKGAPTLGQELPRLAARTVQQAINTPIAIAQQTAAEGLTGTGFAQSLGLLPKDEQRQRDAAVVKKALAQTGRTPEGDQYGWRQDWVGGQYLSNDSPWVNKYVKPKSDITEFSAQLGSALGLSKVTKLFTKAPSTPTITKQVQQFEQVIPKQTFKNNLKAQAAYFINSVAPETVKDALLFPVNIPTPSAKDQAAYDKIKSEADPEVRLNLAEALLANSDSEFKFYRERAINAGLGVGAMYGFKGLLALGRRALQLSNAGVPASKAFDLAADEVGDSAYADFKASAYDDINKEIQNKLGSITSDFNTAVGRNIPFIAEKARLASDNFVTRYPAATESRDKILGELAQFGDITAQRAELDAQVAQAQKEVGVQTPEELVAKLQKLEQRLAAYDEAQAADPDWINKSTGTGKRASKNSSKVRQVKEAIDAIKRFEDLSMQRQAFNEIDQQHLLKTTELTKADTEVIASKNDFQKIVSELQTTLDEHNVYLADRANAVEADIAQKMREGTAFEDISPDTFDQDPGYQLHGELFRLVREAQDAINFDQLSPEYIDNWLQRMEDVHDRAITEGVSAMPMVPDTTGLEDLLGDAAAAAPEGPQSSLTPRKPYPMENRVPLTEDDMGNPVLNQDEINNRNAQGLENLDAESPTAVDPDNYIRSIKEDIGTNKQPKTQEAINSIIKDIDEFDKQYEAALKNDLVNGTNEAEKLLNIFRAANATTYTPDLKDQKLLKAVNDRLVSKTGSTNALAMKAVMQLAEFSDDPKGIKMLSYLLEQGKINRDGVKKLSHVAAQLAMLDGITKNAMAAVQTVKKVQNGADVDGLTLEESMALAMDQMKLMFAAVKAVDPLAQQFGTGLGLFASDKRLRWRQGASAIDLAADEWNQRLLGIGDIDEVIESTSKAAELAETEFDAAMGDVLKKLNKGEALTDEEIGGALNLIGKVRESNGNLARIKELELTKAAVNRRIITSGIYNPLAGPPSIVTSGFTLGAERLAASAVSGLIQTAAMKFTRNAEKAATGWKQYQETSKWLKNYIYGVGAMIPDLYNKLIFPTPNANYNPTRGSLLRQDAILDDLAADSFNIKTPFTEWQATREDLGDVYDILNKGRVLFKVWHDSFIPGEAWEKAGKLANVLGYSTSVPRQFGFGKTSFYPEGEKENMTAVFKLLGLGDEIVSSVMGNAWHRTQIEFQIEDEIRRGVLNPDDAAATLKTRLKERTKEMFDPITVGSSDTVVGHKIRDKQFQAFKALVTQTEALTGGLSTVEDAIQTLQNHQNPQIAAFASYLMPATGQTLNWLKQATSIASGVEVGIGIADAARSSFSLAAKNLPEGVASYLQQRNPKTLQSIIDFESKYTSDDPIIRQRAQQALGLALAYHTIAFQMVWNSDLEITGNLGQGQMYKYAPKDQPFIITANLPVVGQQSIDYRYLFPTLGATIAAQTIFRDLSQFEPSTTINNLFGMIAAIQANMILDTPSLAGTDRINEALQKAGDGDVSPLFKLAADYMTKYGNPYQQLTKQIVRGIRPGKPADLTSRYQRKAAISKVKVGKSEKFNFGTALRNTVVEVGDTMAGLVGPSFESNGLNLMFDAIEAVVTQNPEKLAASRQALWYGKSGEILSYSKLPQLAYPIQAVTDRFMPFYSKTDDPVYQAMRDNLVAPPGVDLFARQNVKISKTSLNSFNHFLNSESLFIDPWTGKTHVGLYSFVKSIISRPEYKNRAQVTSPFKGKDFNWERQGDPSGDFLRAEVRKAINIAKDQWVRGENQILDPKTGKYRPQQYKADPSIVEMLRLK